MESNNFTFEFRNQLEMIKRGVFSIKAMGLVCLMLLLLCCLSLLMVPMSEPTTRRTGKGGKGCGCKRCGGNGHECGCGNGHECGCGKGVVLEGFEDTGNKVSSFDTRKFEMLSENTSENAPKNMLFGEGEFIFTKDSVHIFIMASLYTIGANLYASKQNASDLSYNVYIGDNKDSINFKLGKLLRSQDNRYKFESKSSNPEFIKALGESKYIQVRLESVDNTLNELIIEARY
ncbi:hypothetical protein SAGO17_0003 [Mimivirus AB-566-O17]|uniref:Uncharacterized protein n=1 Tax=Mimivirus AB-566-O17 TaxID=1988039 RepID=A0A1X9VNL4_9VIRU|nr:hypothetical protein SAGO17_0003 [Mimivirus AB-566-O17]